MSHIQQGLEVVLQQIKTGNTQLVREGENQAKQWENESYAHYAFALAVFLATPNHPVEDRHLSSVLLRRTITADDPELLRQKQQKWIQIPDEAKISIKKACLTTMADPVPLLGNAAAQTVARIAAIELPQGQWRDLIPALLANATQPDVAVNLKKASLEAFGFICDTLTPEDLQHSAEVKDQILTAVVHGMRPDEPNDTIKLAACNSLFLALNFCQANFERPAECKVIMDCTMAAMRSANEDIVVQAYAILTQIASQHYDKLAPSMHQIFEITLAAIAKGESQENITMMAIEFWCTICDEELSIIEEIEYSRESGEPATRECKHFIKGALQYVVQLLAACLTLQDADTDADECTIPLSATICLTLISQCVKDDILQYMMPFVEKNINSEDWKHREAALLGFGAILEGPTSLDPWVTKVTPCITRFLKDPMTQVKDTSARALGNILKLHPKPVVQHGEVLVKNLCETLGDASPRVATKACVALHHLAISFENVPDNPLQKHFVTVVRMLLMCADRPDSHEEHLCPSAYEALNVVLDTANEANKDNLIQVVRLMLDRIKGSFTMEILSQDDINKQNQLQGLLCGVLEVLTRKLDTAISPPTDEIMMQVITLFRSKKDSGVYEEGLLCVAAVASVVGPNFIRFMNDLLPHLLASLANTQEHQVCNVAVGCVADIARALGVAVEPYCDKIVNALLENLKNKELDRSVKPSILSAFGDIALAIGPYFERYVEVVLNMLKQAAQTVMNTTLKPDDEDLIDYINLLREGICEAYTAAIQTLNSGDASKTDKISPHFSALFSFLLHIANDRLRNEAVTRAAVGIIGDLASTYTVKVKPFMQTPAVQALITDCYQNSTEKESKKVAQWAQQVTRF